MNTNPYDTKANDRAAQEKAAQAQTSRKTEADDYAWLMGDVRGRRIMKGLLDFCGVYRTSFTGNSHTFFNEGQRNVGLVLIGMVHSHAPEQYPVMMQENTKK